MYADPPWKYDNQKNNDPSMGGVTYPVLSVKDIADLPIQGICEKDCALFLWATYPKLREAFFVMDAWGFKYTTVAFTWVKTNPKKGGYYSGMGHWTNGNAEIVLFGKKGTPKRQNKSVKQIIESPVGKHSTKPDCTRDRIVTLMGDLPRVELFGRKEVPGWTVLGNEVTGRDIRDDLNLIERI